MSPSLSGFAVRGYKAFARDAQIRLAPLTVLLGRNNAGKSALCHAPLFLTYPFLLEANPFPLTYQGVDFGTNFLEICFRRQPGGLHGTVFLRDSGGVAQVSLGVAALAEQGYRQIVTSLEIVRSERSVKIDRPTPWEKVRELLTGLEFAGLASQVEILLARRKPPERNYRYLGNLPEGVGPCGEDAVQFLAQAKADGREDLLADVNSWFAQLDVRFDIVTKGSSFDVVALGPSGEAASLVDTGEGITQILPLVVRLKGLASQSLPRLLVVEQPELHLHPRAHAKVAELFIDALASNRKRSFLLETHSDSIVLRIRREVAAGRMHPDDVALYFVDEINDRPGSIVKPIALNDRGTPDWWPKGVFAENQAEFYAIRQELAKRDAAP